jgi:hypothetical protein
MRRILRGLAPLFLASFGACSLINAPAEVDTGGGGSGGGQPCTTTDDCTQPGGCSISECKDGTCKEQEAPNNTPCDDGLSCTEDDFCASGVCQSGSPMECTPQDDCHVSLCAEAAQGCVETLKDDGAICDDQDACTSSSTCVGGTCTSGPGCQNDECSTSTCDPTVGCMTTPNPIGTECGNTFCSTGQCDGAGKCVIMALNVGLPCDDGLFCTTDELCSPVGLCQGALSPCLDPSACVKATCNEDTDACDFNAILAGETCEDGDACTGGETCNAAALCSGAQPAFVAFFDDFANLNGQGWELGPEWQIGPTAVSVGGNVCCDPAMDFDGNNNIAGVALGGNAMVVEPRPQHPFHYLTSPIVDTSAVPGPLFLTYYRWLLSDYPPYMHNVVEVSMDGGASWFVAWSQPDNGTPIMDTEWTFQSHDLTSFKSPTLRFRIGFDIGQPGVYQAGSWNIDHVKLQNTQCPQ